MTLVVIIAVIAALAFHAGHGTANYRHARSRGHGRRPSLYLGARGAWISVPGPFGTRIGRRI